MIRSGSHWVTTWVSMPQAAEPDNMPPAPFTATAGSAASGAGPDRVLADATLRQTVRVSVGGGRIRLRFSNAFADAPLPLAAVTVARPLGRRAGVSAIETGTTRPVTFHGRPSVVVPVGALVVSDPLTFDLAPRSDLTVTVYLAEGLASRTITSHPGSRTTSYLAAGNHVAAGDLSPASPVDHWYLLSGVEVWCARTTSAVVLLGDSLTDGRGSTTNGNDRWPDRLAERLSADPGLGDVAVLNQAAGGNRVLADGLGPSVLARLDRDVLAQSGVRWLVVFEGVNDIGTAEATETAQKRIADDLIAAYDQIIMRAHAHGIRVYGATLPPFGGHESYDDPAGHRDRARRVVNEWIRAGALAGSSRGAGRRRESLGEGRFDAVIDLDAAVRDPSDPRRLRPGIHDGDGLHLNPTGYQLLADAVPLELFRPD